MSFSAIAGGLTTTATTAEQEIISGTPLATTSFKSAIISGYYTTYSATEAALGVVFMDIGGTNDFEARIQNTDLASLAGVIVIPFGDGVTFDGSTAIAWQVTPASTTSIRWYGAFYGEAA